MNKKLIRCLTCALFLCCLISPVFGQNARFSGQVTDSQGAAIPKAKIQVTNEDTAVTLTTTTDTSGNYTVPYLSAGHYQVIVQAPGFNQYISVLALGMGQALNNNIQLTVGSAQATVDVTASSEVTQVNTQNAEVSGTITGKEVAGLQLNGRNFTQLIALTPGVSNQTQQDEARVGLRGSVSYSVNGGRTEYNSFLVDGSETMNVGINKDHTSLVVTPSIDAIQEIKVLTSNYGAMYPSTGNGTTIVTTKSGADQLHGNLFEFVRNEMFNAKGYFDVTNGAPLYRRNDFGGTIGGPVVIPHLYDGRGKTHFFFSEEARFEKDPYPFRQAVPSLAERSGDFSDVCPGADCPHVQGMLEQYHVPVAATATAILNSGTIPLPNSYTGCNSTTGYCFLSEAALPTYYREELFRLDHNLSDKTQASFRYIHDEWDTTVPVPQYGFTQNSFPTIQNRLYGPGISLAGRVTHSFSATLLNEFVASYVDQLITMTDVGSSFVSLQRPAVLDAPTCAVVTNSGPVPTDQNNGPGTTCGLGHIFNNGFGGKMPGIVIAGNNAEYGGTGFSVDPSYMPWQHTNPTYSFMDNVTKVLGSHSLQFGAQWVLFQRNQINGPSGAATGDVQGLLTFSNEQSLYTTGNAFADFLGMGAIASVQQDSAQGRYYQRYQIAEPYFQDDWKATTRLTVNAGVRLSLFGTYHEKNGNAYNWVPTAYSRSVAESVIVDGTTSTGQGRAATGELLDAVTGQPIPTYLPNGSVDPRVTNGIVQCGKNGVPNGCMTGRLWNFAPRIGFAWDPQGNGKNSIRMGYGVFFEHGTSDEANTGSLEGSAPMVLSMTQLSPYGAGCIGNTGPGCPLGPGAFPLNVTAIPTKAVWPYVQQWSVSVEHELPRNMLASFAYVGSKGTHLTLEREINQLVPTPAAANPFGTHDPFLTVTCQQYGSGSDPGVGYDGYYYHLPNGNVVSATAPGAVNLRTACYGEGQGGEVDPNAFRQYAPGLGEIYSLENTANASYNAFQTAIRQTTGPLTLSVAYTYSHSIDNSSDRSDGTFVDSFNTRFSRASSNFDQRHLLHVSYIYELPILRGIRALIDWVPKDPGKNWTSSHPPSTLGTSTLAKNLLDGWQLSGITLFESGIPFTVINGGSANGVSVLDNAGVDNGVGAGSYPDLIGNPHRNIPAGGNNGSSVGPLLYNPGAFAAPRGLTFGDAGRNSLNNPHRWNFDAALQKNFKLPSYLHGSSLLFRAEAFNVFNHTQFRIYDPNPTLGQSTANRTASCYSDSATTGYSAAGDATTNCLAGSSFLHPVDAHLPRTIQFGLKLAF
jgi:hypothetical protein